MPRNTFSTLMVVWTFSSNMKGTPYRTATVREKIIMGAVRHICALAPYELSPFGL
jgi:hypothetical protein